MNKPTLIAVEMGYGHLRPAHALGDYLGVPVQEADRPPFADAEERRLWARARGPYEQLTRLSQVPLLGLPLKPALAVLTAIPPLNPPRDLSAPTWSLKLIDRLAQRGLGDGLIAHLRATGSPLLSTFFVPALVADRAGGLDVRCLVTDSDINRVWAPLDSRKTRILYYAPSTRAVRRLVAYGVPRSRIQLTGFPLPHSLVGGRDMAVARPNLARRLGRLDPHGVFHKKFGAEVAHVLGEAPPADGPPRVTFAVGGAGAQAELADAFLPSLAPALRTGQLVLTLVAGVRREVAERFSRAIAATGLDDQLERGTIEILLAPDLPAYFRQFNDVLARTDALWTKPSELTFFAALGLPLILAPPVGEHERLNARWATEHGAALPQRDPRAAWHWLEEWLADGTLAQAAWSGFRGLPRNGLYEIADSFT